MTQMLKLPAADAGVVAGAGGGAAGVAPVGGPPISLVGLPLAFPSPIPMATGVKKLEAEYEALSTTKKRDYCNVIRQGNNLPDPGALVLILASTRTLKPKCFLVLRMNLAGHGNSQDQTDPFHGEIYAQQTSVTAATVGTCNNVAPIRSPTYKLDNQRGC